jgi:hypothetical protein
MCICRNVLNTRRAKVWTLGIAVGVLQASLTPPPDQREAGWGLPDLPAEQIGRNGDRGKVLRKQSLGKCGIGDRATDYPHLTSPWSGGGIGPTRVAIAVNQD